MFRDIRLACEVVDPQGKPIVETYLISHFYGIVNALARCSHHEHYIGPYSFGSDD